MNCCEPTIVQFVNEASKSVNYSAFMVQQYGAEPNVQVYYLQDGEYVLSDDMNQVKFDGTDIVVDLGGPASGFIKIF
jgi:hypothetical protein